MQLNNFARACKSRNTTPSTLGRKLKINPSSMRRYASGEHVPKEKRQEKIEKALGVKIWS